MGFVSAALGVVSLFQGHKEASAANRAARNQARVERKITAEKIHNLEVEERTLRGQTIATAAGSGIKASVGSPLTILAEQAKSFARERGFISEVGAANAQATIQRGRNTAGAARMRGISGAFSAFGGMGKSMFANKGGGFIKSMSGFG